MSANPASCSRHIGGYYPPKRGNDPQLALAFILYLAGVP